MIGALLLAPLLQFAACTPELDCVRIHLYVVGAKSGDDPSAFIETQLAGANLLFAPTGLSFELASTEPLPEVDPKIVTRAQRDALGHTRFARGEVIAFVVDELWDVDVEKTAPRQIRGVHWRDRAASQHRWVIVSRISPPHVLGHELGHFFGLPHSTDPASVMNKTPRTEPPPEARGFTAPEQAVIRASARRFFRDGTLQKGP